MISQNAFLKSWSNSERATKNPFNKTFSFVWIIYHFCIENDFFHVGGKLLLAFYFFLKIFASKTHGWELQQVHSNDIFEGIFLGLHPDLDWLNMKKNSNSYLIKELK